MNKTRLQHTLSMVFIFLLCTGSASARTAGGVYDMTQLLNEMHPFASIRPGPRLQVISGDNSSSPLGPSSIIKLTPPSMSKARGLPVTVRPTVIEEPSSTVSNREYRKLGYGGRLSDIFNEVRVGVLIHDEGPFSRNKEDGIDTNFELLFTSPNFLGLIRSPRPHLGATINSSGNTSQAYLGMTWEWDFWREFFFNFSVGGVAHTGEKDTSDLDKKSLGCSILFRESLNVGYRVSGPHSIMFHFDHISNAKLCSTNEGLETFGIRYGYRF